MIGYDPNDALAVFPEGIYAATLQDVEETVSRNNNPMYKLTIKVYHKTRGEMSIFDYSVIPSMLWKIKKLARAMGKLEVFEAGNYDPASDVGKTVYVDLSVESHEKYGDQNRIEDYMSLETAKARAADKAGEAPEPKSSTPAPPDDDDLPF